MNEVDSVLFRIATSKAFFVNCRIRSLILGLSVGQSEKKKKPKKWRRSLELGGLVPQHNNMRSLEMTRRG